MKLTEGMRLALDRHRAQDTSSQVQAAELAARLRSFYYPKQRAFFESKAKLRATKKTRRAGATTGSVRELLARALLIPGFRATYVASTRIEAKARAWENDTRNGLVDVIREFGTPMDVRGVEKLQFGGVEVEVREGDLALEFTNGSKLNLFGADDERAINKQRGLAKHVYLIDEAQDFRFLEKFYKAVIFPALQDYSGECWVMGTPGQDCAGMFYAITKDDESDGPRMPGWEVHQFAQVDNPFFGATPEERYERTVGEAMRLNGWTLDDPDLQREGFGRWVRQDGNYVYAVHQVPEHELCFAPARYDIDGFPELDLAMEDLPERARRNYFIQAGADLGTRAAFAFTLWAWSLEDPTLYEVASWKKSGLDYDEMATVLRQVRERLHIGAITADAGGGGKPAVMGWSKDWAKRYDVPIEEAEKHNKQVAIKLLNNDIRTGAVKLRSGGVLLAEMRVHRWEKIRNEKGNLVEASTPHDAGDSALYGHRMSYHHRGKVPETPPPVGSPERFAREEAQVERDMEDAAEERAWWA